MPMLTLTPHSLDGGLSCGLGYRLGSSPASLAQSCSEEQARNEK